MRENVFESIKEPNINAKWVKKFTSAYDQGRRGWPPPLSQPDCSTLFLDDSPLDGKDSDAARDGKRRCSIEVDQAFEALRIITTDVAGAK